MCEMSPICRYFKLHWNIIMFEKKMVLLFGAEQMFVYLRPYLINRPVSFYCNRFHNYLVWKFVIFSILLVIAMSDMEASLHQSLMLLIDSLCTCVYMFNLYTSIAWSSCLIICSIPLNDSIVDFPSRWNNCWKGLSKLTV